MKKIILLTVLSISLFSCGKKEDNTNIDSLISSKNVAGLQAKKALIQADLTKIDEALAILDVKKEEALVSVLKVKDTVFSAASVPGEHACLGFTIRDIGRRLPAEGRSTVGLQRTVGQLTELVGRVPLKDIVGETTDLIEQLCIEAALELTRDNRASAAEMLGLSRQSLYVKLRRYGLGDLGVESANK